MKSKQNYPIKKFYLYSVLVVGLSLIIIFTLFSWYRYANPRSLVSFHYYAPSSYERTNEKLTFQGYEHTFLPPLKQSSWVKSVVYFTYDLPQQRMYVIERGDKKFEGCNYTLATSHCGVKVTSQNITYVAGTSLDKEIFDQKATFVSFMKDDTWIFIGTSEKEGVSIKDWEALIDSFEDTSYRNVPYVFYSDWPYID